MTKLKGSECEVILKTAGGAIRDKGLIGTDYIVTPVRKPQGSELYMSEHDYNNQVSSLRTPVERAVASLKTWRILFAITEGRWRRSGHRSEPLSASAFSKAAACTYISRLNRPPLV
jgi:hypothetical protein